MSIKRLKAGSWASEAVIYNGTVYISPQFADGGDNMHVQTANALSRVDRVLSDAGSDREHILSITIWLNNNNDDWGMAAGALEEWLPGDDNGPAVFFVESSQIVGSDSNVMVGVIAAVK